MTHVSLCGLKTKAAVFAALLISLSETQLDISLACWVEGPRAKSSLQFSWISPQILVFPSVVPTDLSLGIKVMAVLETVFARTGEQCFVTAM